MKKSVIKFAVALVFVCGALLNFSAAGNVNAVEEFDFGTVPNRTDRVFNQNTIDFCVFQCYDPSNWDCTFTPNYGYDCPSGGPSIDP
ncbi:MAG: hypothetical protein HEP71_20880 [Roseivirga sp.]|nr:hypothetical protein [Roseivirga sp.]